MNRQTLLSVAVGLVSLALGALLAVTLEAERAARTGASTWLPSVAASPALTAMVYDNVVAVVGFVLSPMLLFAVGFVFGRRIDLPRTYGGVLRALLVGCVMGYGAGLVAAVLWTYGLDLPAAAVFGMVVPAVVFGAARAVLVGFAGVSVGYLSAAGTRRDVRAPEEGQSVR
jgi:hypothetical protein